MTIDDVKSFCDIFYKRFSTLSLGSYQLKFFDSPDSVSLGLVKRTEDEEVAAVININEDEVRLIKIPSFNKIDSVFNYDTPLELYTNLLTLLLVCCIASGVIISPTEALTVTLGRKLKTWRELVIYIASLSPEEQATILVQENGQNALKMLKTTFHVVDGLFITDGLYKSQTSYKDVLELLRAVLDAVSSVFKIYDYVVDPFFEAEDPSFGAMQGFPQVPAGMQAPAMPSMPAPMDVSGMSQTDTTQAGFDAASLPVSGEGFPGDVAYQATDQQTIQ